MAIFSHALKRGFSPFALLLPLLLTSWNCFAQSPAAFGSEAARNALKNMKVADGFEVHGRGAGRRAAAAELCGAERRVGKVELDGAGGDGSRGR